MGILREGWLLIFKIIKINIIISKIWHRHQTRKFIFLKKSTLVEVISDEKIWGARKQPPTQNCFLYLFLSQKLLQESFSRAKRKCRHNRDPECFWLPSWSSLSTFTQHKAFHLTYLELCPFTCTEWNYEHSKLICKYWPLKQEALSRTGKSCL